MLTRKSEFACCCSTFNEDRKAIATLSKVRVRVRAVRGGHIDKCTVSKGDHSVNRCLQRAEKVEWPHFLLSI